MHCNGSSKGAKWRRPAYFRSSFLPSTVGGFYGASPLESVFVQGVPEVEVIVVDDGSTDDTKAVVGAYGGRVKYVYQENRGPAAAKNEGIRRARGRYMAFLDSDDVWLPGKLHTELEHFHAFPTADVVISNCESWVENTLLSDSWLRDRFGERDWSAPAPAFCPNIPLAGYRASSLPPAV